MIVKSLRETMLGMWSLLVGMKVTAVNFKSTQITVHYPREVVHSLEGYRGHIELVPSDEDPYKPKCIACNNCVRICPSACISLTAIKPKKKAAEKTEAPDSADEVKTKGKKEAPAKKAKPELESFVCDYNYCCLCGLCVQSCPTGALRYSSNVYLAGFTRQEFVLDLLSRLQNQAQKKEQ